MKRKTQILKEYGLKIQRGEENLSLGRIEKIKQIALSNVSEKKEKVCSEIIYRMLSDGLIVTISDKENFSKRVETTENFQKMPQVFLSEINFYYLREESGFVAFTKNNLMDYFYMLKEKEGMKEFFHQLYPGYEIHKAFSPEKANKRLGDELQRYFEEFEKEVRTMNLEGLAWELLKSQLELNGMEFENSVWSFLETEKISQRKWEI